MKNDFQPYLHACKMFPFYGNTLIVTWNWKQLGIYTEIIKLHLEEIFTIDDWNECCWIIYFIARFVAAFWSSWIADTSRDFIKRCSICVAEKLAVHHNGVGDQLGLAGNFSESCFCKLKYILVAEGYQISLLRNSSNIYFFQNKVNFRISRANFGK